MRTNGTQPSARSGVVIIAVLLVVAILSLAAYQYAEVMTSEYKAADAAARSAQAHAAAYAGIYYAAAMLADPSAFAGTLGNNPFNNSGAFQGIAVGSGDNPRKQARFSIVAPPDIDAALGGDQ